MTDGIENEVGNSRFVLHLGGDEAELTYRLDGNRIILDYVGVPHAWRNRGYAAQLTRAALDWAREKGLEAVPVCPYVIWHVQHHPEYHDLVR